jgi:hypothetical protein
MPCNAICLPEYKCGALQNVRPEGGAVYAPFITMNLGTEITVGNNSFGAEPNTAVIRSMDFGGSTGSGVEVEIVDESGSSFNQFFEALNKDICSTSDDYKMTLDFGWVVRQPDGSVVKSGIPEGPLHFLPATMESNYEGGVVKYKITGTDLLDRVSQNRVDAPVGTEANKVPVSDAIREMASRNCPSIENVRMVRRRGNSLSEWRFRNSDGGAKGPRGVWQADQQNALSAIRKWSNSLTTDRKKGWTTVWNPGSKTPELWLFEDTRTYCNESDNGGLDCIGTYIVGGGDCSPVISFSPSSKYTLAASLGSGGNAGGATSSRMLSQKKRTFKERSCAKSPNTGGVTSQFPAAQGDINWRPPDDVVVKQQEALAKQELAAEYVELTAPLEGELTIVGDQRFSHPITTAQKMVSIILINPHHIYSGGSYSEWLAGPMCNPVYSDKEWQIMGVSHQIQEGSFTTKFKVKCVSKNKSVQS